MSNHIVKYYPVDNGDNSLIKLQDKKTVITDCKIRDAKDDIFDVKKDLLDNLETRDKKPFVDLFVLSHHDNDHCLNFEKHFFCGKVSDYNKKEDENKIIIDELWVNAFILSDDTISKDSSAWHLKKEVERRRDLYKNKKSEKDERGNRLVLIGTDEDDNFKNVPQHIPGNEITNINNEEWSKFGIFIHAPLKQSIIEGNADGDRNATSIVYQARFYDSNNKYIARIIHSGDADHYRWAKIKEKTEKHENKDALHWDIFLAPHHCSWTFFNNTPYKDTSKGIDNSTPKTTSTDVLDYKNSGAWIVASCKEIKNNDDNPPHYPAYTEYKNSVGTSKFKDTASFYKKHEKPIVFEIKEDGGLKLLKTVPAVSISQGHSKPSRAGKYGG